MDEHSFCVKGAYYMESFVTSRKIRILVPLCSFAVTVLMYGLTQALPQSSIVPVCLFPVVIACLLSAYLFVNKRFKAQHAAALILLLALAVRVIYIAATPWQARQHDVFGVTDSGHAGYIFYLFAAGKLPESNTGLLYHPPLSHFLLSLYARFSELFVSNTETLMENLQTVTAYWSLMCGWVFLRLLETLKVKKETALLFFAFFSLHPTLLILGGSINNDCLCFLLSMVTLLYLLRFAEKQTMFNAVMMGAALGCAMMAKLSAVLLAPVIAAVFVWKLIKPDGDRLKTLASEMVFGAVSIPLGMWYPVRNLIKFGQPFGYVMRISEQHPLYCGDRSIAERFLSFPLAQVFEDPFCDPFEDYNVPIYTLKCSVFGEFSFSFPKWTAVTLVMLNLLVILLFVALGIYALVKKRSAAVYILTSAEIITIISFISFNIEYPHGCTMDFRYILPCLPCSALIAAAGAQRINKKAVKVSVICVLSLFTAAVLMLFTSRSLFI